MIAICPKKLNAIEISQAENGVIVRNGAQETWVYTDRTPNNLIAKLNKELSSLLRCDVHIDMTANAMTPQELKLKLTPTPPCPSCGSGNVIRHGHRGEVQRYLCHGCCRTFPLSRRKKTLKLKPKELIQVSAHSEPEDSSGLIMGTYSAPRNHQKSKRNNRAFKFATEFNLAVCIREKLGTELFLWNCNGTIAVKKNGMDSILFLRKTDIHKMKKMRREELESHLGSISIQQREIILTYIDALLDEEAGILPFVHNETKVAVDCGDIDAETFHKGFEIESSDDE